MVTHVLRGLSWLTVSASCLLAVGCGGGAANAPATSSGANAAAASDTGPEMKACPDGKIDDMEDNDAKTAALKGRGGWWYTYSDKTSDVTPTGDFKMTAGGAGGSKYAAHISGKTGKEGNVYAGVGFWFADKTPYDGTAYKGIAFKAKVGKGSVQDVRVSLPDINTDQDGGRCKECFNNFGKDLSLTEEWKRYTLPFKALKQEAGWGEQKPALDLTKLFKFQLQVKKTAVSYDVWLDDIEFVCE